MFFNRKQKHDVAKNSGGTFAGMLAGLGNPGNQYAGTRHNLGAMALLALLEQLDKLDGPKPQPLALGKKYNCQLWRAQLPGCSGDWLLALPLTYMNLSGQAIAPLLRWHKLEPEQLLVAHDELDLAPGRIQLKKGGGVAGHRGLISIAECLGSNDFNRLRLGIGRPQFREDVVNWVLGRFYGEDLSKIEAMLPQAVEALLLYARQGIAQAVNTVNMREKKKSAQNDSAQPEA